MSQPKENAAKEAPVLPVPPSERYRFETWAEGHGLDVEREEETGDYASRETSVAWSSWQARSSSPAVAPTDEHAENVELKLEIARLRSIAVPDNERCPKCKSPWKEQRNHISWGIGDICTDEWHKAAPAVAGRTQGDDQKSAEQYFEDTFYTIDPVARESIIRAYKDGRRAALRESAREAPSEHHYNAMKAVLAQILIDLPSKKDWLDPAIERVARSFAFGSSEASPEAPSHIECEGCGRSGPLSYVGRTYTPKTSPEAPAADIANLGKIDCPKCGKDSSGAYRIKGSTGDFRCFVCLNYFRLQP